MGNSRKLMVLVAVAVVAVFAASCGGDDGKVTVVTETVTTDEPVQLPKVTAEQKQAQARAVKQVRDLDADCTIVVVTLADQRAKIQRPFFCKQSVLRVKKNLPLSPFAAEDECRLDYEPTTLYSEGKGYWQTVIVLSQSWPRFTPKCKRIRFVVFATQDEDVVDYAREAPLTRGKLKPGQKAYYTPDPGLREYQREYGKFSQHAQ